MYYVYVLRSLKHRNWFYVGYSDDLKTRYSAHNSGKVKSTKSHMPLHLMCYEAYLDGSDARRRERELKTHQQRNFLKERIKGSLSRFA